MEQPQQRVRLEEVIGEDNYEKTANGHLSKKERKRHRQKLEAEESDSAAEEHRKRKKSKGNVEHLSSQEEDVANVQNPKKHKKREKLVIERNYTADSNDNASHSKKLKKQVDRGKEREVERTKKRQKTRTFETKKTNKTFPLSLSQPSMGKNSTAQASTKKSGTSSDSTTTSSDSDHSVTNLKQKPAHKTKVAAEHTHKSQLDSLVKLTSAGKLATKPKDGNAPRKAKSNKAKSQSSSSDTDSSSGEEEEQKISSLKSKLLSNSRGTATGLTSKPKPQISSSDSDSSDSETCTIKKPKTNTAFNQSLGGNDGKLPAATYGQTASLTNAARGRGRGENVFWRGPRVRGCRGIFRGRGRGRGESTNLFYNYNGEHQKQQQLNEAATNTSVIIQNPVEAPKKDYSTLPLLAAPPQVGEKIAFKLLELTENYTPEVSDYKEGKIVSWNPTNKQLELEILSFSSMAKEPGKFDLVYQSADGAETIEYAVSQDRKITESWDALIEPRLIVDPPNTESSIGNGNP
ncbi:coilin isoform X2 [Hemicordylus capensis]|uniref:coilin isoform X2 n=1 Tax=Hemicordylus capensis TaxID=884348 RepID=UPI0023044E48|nr:coilin isoform X2 [Hemicordylus capensis]